MEHVVEVDSTVRISAIRNVAPARLIAPSAKEIWKLLEESLSFNENLIISYINDLLSINSLLINFTWCIS